MFDSYQRRIKDKLPPQLLQTLRVLQFLAAIVSIILYIVYIVRKATTTSSDGAILGITAGAIVWTVIALGKACFAKRKIVILVLLAVILDIAFVGAYIAIVALTGGAATGSCGRRQGDDDDDNSDSDSANGSITNCNLKKGVFALAIINIIQHLFSALMEHFHKPPASIKHPTRSGNLVG